jgi:hypothetical protein
MIQRPELFDFGNIRISIVYIQLGDNDLSRKSAEKTATDIVSFANFLNELAPIVIVEHPLIIEMSSVPM